MKILLVYPPFQVGHGMGKVMCSPPLSLLSLAGAIPDHNVEILDLNTDYSYGIDKLENKIKKYDLVGMTFMTSMYRVVENICKIAKRNEVQTVVGGFHPTLDPHVLEETNYIDMIVRGEGEITFKEILNGKPKEDILGLSYKTNGKYYHNPDRPFIKNMDDLPYTKKELLDYSPYHYLWIPADVVETSRGCPFSCRFCCVTKFYNQTYRTKSPERVINELLRVPSSQKLVFFVDDNFTLNHKRVMKICDLIQKTHLNKHLMFVCQSRVDDIANEPEMVKKMGKSGFICFFLGFESFKQMALDQMGKKYTLDIVRKAIKLCHDNGIMVFGSFIIGNITENRTDTLRTFKLMKELEIDLMMTNPITPFPGTPLYDDALKNGWLDKKFKWKDWDFKAIMSTPDLTIDEIRELVHESYKDFYLDIGNFLFGKKLLRLLSPKFSWFIKVAPTVFSNGLNKFLMNL
jgi:anaerobic magnesium-protoporphyrin IX monomethyl ester cyclase